MEITASSTRASNALDTPPVQSGVREEDWRLFNPSIEDDGTAYATLRRLAKLPSTEAITRLSAYADSQDADTLQTLKTRVSATLLRDLLRIGWEVYANAHHVYVRPPKLFDPVERKAVIRQQLLYGRDDQLAEDSHRRFLYSLNP